jgi:hypothetical protein
MSSIAGHFELLGDVVGTVKFALTDESHVYIGTNALNVGPLLKYRDVEYYAGVHLNLNDGQWAANNPHIAKSSSGKVAQRVEWAIIKAIIKKWTEFITPQPELLIDAQIAQIKNEIEQIEEDEARMHEKILDMRRQVGKLNWQLDTLHTRQKALLVARNG